MRNLANSNLQLDSGRLPSSGSPQPTLVVFENPLLKPTFISFEGIDGAGKSTHLPVVAQQLRQAGFRVLLTREPGGTELAEQLRSLLLKTPMDPLTEALLVFAARRDHVQQVIAPALARGEMVVCDRFSDASAAYQGGGRGVPLEVLEQLEHWVHPGLQPDLTFWFDLPPELAAQRLVSAREPDRFEQQDLAFFERVRQAYLHRATQAPKRFVRIDASANRADVALQIQTALQALNGWATLTQPSQHGLSQAFER